MTIVNLPSSRHRGIYLLPNLFTTIALFAGFYAIMTALKGRLEDAAIAIFIAMIADTLDGRVARLTQTQTAFGAEYDSLSDMVSFGVAPAVLSFIWGLSMLGNLGWLITFCYTAATALRLARFNTQVGIADKRYFQGLPCPPAAALVTSFIWVAENNQWQAKLSLVILLGILTFLAAVLMVSRFRFHSFKQFNWQGRIPFVSLILLVVVFAFIALDLPQALLLISLLFSLSGPILTLWNLRQRQKMRKGH